MGGYNAAKGLISRGTLPLNVFVFNSALIEDDGNGYVTYIAVGKNILIK